jgi:hypothetical protein
MENKTTYKVPAENVDALQRQIDTLNKRVARLVKKGHDVKPIAISVGPMFAEMVYGVQVGERETMDVERVFCNVQLLSPESPTVKGWEFVAALTHVDDVGTVLRVCPGTKIEEGELKQYRTASPVCQHCNTKRKRNDTFVIRKIS